LWTDAERRERTRFWNDDVEQEQVIARFRGRDRRQHHHCLRCGCQRRRQWDVVLRLVTGDRRGVEWDPAADEERGRRLDALNERLMNGVNATGEVFVSHTKLNGLFTLRLAVGNIRTTEGHVRRAWQLLNEKLAELADED
jgi:hypothetical protein